MGFKDEISGRWLSASCCRRSNMGILFFWRNRKLVILHYAISFFAVKPKWNKIKHSALAGKWYWLSMFMKLALAGVRFALNFVVKGVFKQLLRVARNLRAEPDHIPALACVMIQAENHCCRAAEDFQGSKTVGTFASDKRGEE